MSLVILLILVLKIHKNHQRQSEYFYSWKSDDSVELGASGESSVFNPTACMCHCLNPLNFYISDNITVLHIEKLFIVYFQKRSTDPILHDSRLFDHVNSQALLLNGENGVPGLNAHRLAARGSNLGPVHAASQLLGTKNCVQANQQSWRIVCQCPGDLLSLFLISLNNDPFPPSFLVHPYIIYVQRD